jgi:hypothetical protein
MNGITRMLTEPRIMLKMQENSKKMMQNATKGLIDCIFCEKESKVRDYYSERTKRMRTFRIIANSCASCEAMYFGGK